MRASLAPGIEEARKAKSSYRYVFVFVCAGFVSTAGKFFFYLLMSWLSLVFYTSFGMVRVIHSLDLGPAVQLMSELALARGYGTALRMKLCSHAASGSCTASCGAPGNGTA